MMSKFAKKLIGDEAERAVSPVIGVILMVAITVILAAVIATFVLDLGDSIDQEAQAGISIDGDETTDVSVELTSSGSADGVAILVTGSQAAADAELLESVGDRESYDGTGDDDGEYTVIAYVGEDVDSSTFTDGTDNTAELEDDAETVTVIGDFVVEDD